MVILPEPLEFEWDEGNIEKNERKHGVSNKEAEEVFVHRPLLIIDDRMHSGDEKRFQAFGTNGQKLLFLVFTIRKLKIRIISARLMDTQERRVYKKAQKTAGI